MDPHKNARLLDSYRYTSTRQTDEGIKIQADLTNRYIGIAAIREGIDTTDNSAAARYFRRMMMANGAYSTSERIEAGLDRAKAEGRKLAPAPPALTPEQVKESRRIYAENRPIRRTARILKVSQGTV